MGVDGGRLHPVYDMAKLPLTPAQQEWFKGQAENHDRAKAALGLVGKFKLNPCVLVFGAGPDGVTCKGCAHLVRNSGHSKNYYKCHFRGNTSGPGTDHKVRWPACSKYEPRK